MCRYSLTPRRFSLPTLARTWLGLALLAGLLGIMPAAPALAGLPEAYLVKDISPGLYSSYVQSLTAVNGVLFFCASDSPYVPYSAQQSDGTNDGTHGYELWRSDGTEAGTELVKDIYPGSSTSSPSGLTVVNGTLFFLAQDAGHGTELWRSDGTEAGTELVEDIYPGVYGSRPSDLTVVNGTLFFTAGDGTHGSELWSLGYFMYMPFFLEGLVPGFLGPYSQS